MEYEDYLLEENERLKSEIETLKKDRDAYYEKSRDVTYLKSFQYVLINSGRYSGYLGGIAVGWSLLKKFFYAANSILDFLECFILLLLCGGIGYILIWGISSTVGSSILNDKNPSRWLLFWCVIIPPVLITIYMIGK